MSDYVNGKEFFAELKVYHAAYTEAVKNGTPKPEISNKAAYAILQIATRLANSHNFINYSYKNEFILDGVLKCVSKISKFDPAKGENAFAYFTQICWNAAILRIKIEQEQSSVKARMIREKMSSEFVAHGVDSDADDGTNSFVEFLKENDSYIDYNELKKEKAAGNPSLKHRNKTAYVKKDIVLVEELPEFDLSLFEEDESE